MPCTPRHCHAGSRAPKRRRAAIPARASRTSVRRARSATATADTTARLMLVALSFCWGLTWPAMRIALDEIPPFSMRVVTLGLGAGALLLVARSAGTRVRHRQLEEPRPSRRLRHSQCAVVLAAERDRDDVRRDRPRRDALLHDADLGRAVRLGRARRTVHARRASSRWCCASPAWRS